LLFLAPANSRSFASLRMTILEHSILPFLLFLKQQRCEVRQIIAPHHPRVPARRFNSCHWNVSTLEPRDEIAVPCDEVIFLSAGNPEQVQTGRISAQRSKLIFFTVSHR